VSGTFFDDLCLIINSYIVLRIAYIGEDKEQALSFTIFDLLFINFFKTGGARQSNL